MTGNTATVLLGLGIIVAVLPVGLLVLFGVERNLERAYPISRASRPQFAPAPVTGGPVIPRQVPVSAPFETTASGDAGARSGERVHAGT